MKYVSKFNFFVLLYNIISVFSLDTIPSGTTKMITINNKLIYVTEDVDDITIFDLDEESNQYLENYNEIKINKRLIKLNEEEFIFLDMKVQNQSI